MLQLFYASFLLLFAETMCIRWLGVEIPVFRAFPNLILMVAFIGASFGIAAPEKKTPRPLLGAAVVLLLLAVLVVPYTPLQDLSLRPDGPGGMPLVLLAIVMIALDSLSLLIVFKAIGTVVGDCFKTLPALPAYSANILGSMLGVGAFALISFCSAPPYIWLLIALAASLAIVKDKIALAAIMVPAAIVSFVVAGHSYWSPYGKLDVHHYEVPANSVYGSGNYMLYSNNVYFHLATHAPTADKLAGFFDKPIDSQQKILALGTINMEMPYKLASHSDDLLILGAGSGNDAAFALNKPVKHIDAVEIDPVIGGFGRRIHPDRPYLNPRISLIINDARSYLKQTDKKYDIIDFSCLDPGGTLNTSAFLRVDNFVYTRECIEETMRCLKPDGIVAMSFATGADSPITARLYNTIKEATGHAPFALCGKSFDSCQFLFGPGIENHPEKLKDVNSTFADFLKFDAKASVWTPTAEQATIKPASDDWPFLYLQFNSSGLIIYSVVLFICVMTPVLILLRGSKDLLSNPEAFSLFFLGEAFMLMETKSCTELSLVWGNTWIVSSVVIFVILCLSFLGNLLVMKIPKIDIRLLYALITVSLLLSFGLHSLPALPLGSEKFVSAFLICLPVLFGGALFSRLLERAKLPNVCFAANLLGVTFGGLLENMCVVGGIKSLSLVALLLYLCSAIPILVKARSKSSPGT